MLSSQGTHGSASTLERKSHCIQISLRKIAREDGSTRDFLNTLTNTSPLYALRVTLWDKLLVVVMDFSRVNAHEVVGIFGQRLVGGGTSPKHRLAHVREPVSARVVHAAV